MDQGDVDWGPRGFHEGNPPFSNCVATWPEVKVSHAERAVMWKILVVMKCLRHEDNTGMLATGRGSVFALAGTKSCLFQFGSKKDQNKRKRKRQN